MKIKIIIAAILLVTSIKAQDSLNTLTGSHGGIIKIAENYKIEVNNSFGCITAYLYDSTLKLIPNKFSTGTVMFYYEDKVSVNKYLIPLGVEGFTADVPNSNYDYFIVSLKINNKFIQARFENTIGIVKKESSKNGN